MGLAVNVKHIDIFHFRSVTDSTIELVIFGLGLVA